VVSEHAEKFLRFVHDAGHLVERDSYPAPVQFHSYAKSWHGSVPFLWRGTPACSGDTNENALRRAAGGWLRTRGSAPPDRASWNRTLRKSVETSLDGARKSAYATRLLVN